MRLRTVVSLLIPTILVLVVVLFGGIYLGGHSRDLPGFVADPLVGDKDTRVLNEALDTVNDSYYRKISKKDLSNAAIKGIVASLGDRFSNYFTPKEYSAYQMTQDSQFSGIGTTVAGDPLGLRIVQVFDESPAARAGVKVGDIITTAGGKSLKGLGEKAATALVKGPMGTDVQLDLLRGKLRKTVTVTRATVSVPQVESRVIDFKGKKYGYIALAQFGGGSHAEVYAGIQKVLKGGAKGIVFDLRNNGGGLVSEAQLVASAFLKDGPIVTTAGRNVQRRTLNATGEPLAPDTPLVVLVNENTASASEIVSGALQDRKRAEIVGTKTFGKGIFQEVIDLSNGGALDITAGQYLTPNGRYLGGRGVKQGGGITPDIVSADPPKDSKTDTQLQRALQAVSVEGATA